MTSSSPTATTSTGSPTTEELDDAEQRQNGSAQPAPAAHEEAIDENSSLGVIIKGVKQESEKLLEKTKVARQPSQWKVGYTLTCLIFSNKINKYNKIIGYLMQRDVMSQFEDEKSSGLVNWRVYYEYFRNMGNCCTVLLLFFFCILVQILFNLSDYWLNVWYDVSFCQEKPKI